jgi:signal transduction histidine kinase
VTALKSDPISSGARRAPQVVVLLDEKARVLSVNKGLAGTGFLGITEDQQIELHAQLHPDCDGACRFRDLWKKAWNGLAMSDSVEWEINDRILGRMLRLNLTRPPTAKDVDIDRRRRYAMLCITDITRHRRDYESLVKRERALLELLREHGVRPDGPANDKDAGTTDGLQRLPADLEERNRSLGRQEILAQELERKRIAGELHDSIAQSVGVIKYQIETHIEKSSCSHPDLDLSMLEGVIDQTLTLIDEIRRISNNLAPSMLEDFGLCVALQGICAEYQSGGHNLRPVCDACVDESDLPDIVKFTVYRVVQEALNNISKHSSAENARVCVFMTDRGLTLEVSDDGVGFENADGGSGLNNMRDRILATHGEFALDTALGQGVTIRATWARTNLDELLTE